MSKEKKAKLHALKGLKRSMHEMGGGSLLDALGKAGEGKETVKASVIAKDKEGLAKGLEKAAELVEGEESSDNDYDGMSKEELIQLLHNK